MDIEHKQRLSSLVDEKIKKDILPLIFTDQQLTEMQLPHHALSDHAFISTFPDRSGAASSGYLVPHMDIRDPRIKKIDLNKLPSIVSVEFEGDKHTFLLRPTYSAPEDSQSWQQTLQLRYKMRRISSDLISSITKEFNFVSKQDFRLGYNPDSIILYTLNDTADSQIPRIARHIQSCLNELQNSPVTKIQTQDSLKVKRDFN